MLSRELNMHRAALVPASVTSTVGEALAGDTSHTKFEVVPPRNATQINEMSFLIRQILEWRCPGGIARRSIRPRNHGCGKVTFTVDEAIKEIYFGRAFAEPGEHCATRVVFPDATRLSRKMAIKLTDVEAERRLNEPDNKTQDFLLINRLQFTECERMASTPWHALTAHQPSCSITHSRLGVDARTPRYRLRPKEPTGFSKWPFH